MDTTSHVDRSSQVVSGFWRRFLADLLDAIVLGVVGGAAAYPFRHAISELRPQPVWIGMLVSLAYYGLLQTRLGSGQTLGKRVLRIQVLRRDGNFLSPSASIGRYLIVSMVFYSGMYDPIASWISPQNGPSFWSLFLVVWLFCACFLLIPLHPLKRGLHDLICGSVVVHKGRYDAAALERMENPRKVTRALGFLTLCTALLLGGTAWATQTALQNVDLDRLEALRTELSKDYEVVRISDMSTGGERRSLHVTVRIPLRVAEDNDQRESLRLRILKQVIASFKGREDYDKFRVWFVSGYHIGIASLNSTP